MVQFKYLSRIVLGKQGYAKVDENLPRKVVLVVDGIIQGSRCNSPKRRDTRVRSYRTVIKEIVMWWYKDKSQRLMEGSG